MREAGKRWGFNGRGRWAHSGMLRAALVIRGEIEEARILNRIYDENMLKRDVGLGQPIIDPVRILLLCQPYTIYPISFLLFAGFSNFT